MKIALIAGTYPPTGGAGARLIRMFEPLSENHDIHIFATGSFVNENTDYKDDNFYIHKVKLPLTMPIAKLVFSGITKRYLFKRMKKFGVFDAIFSYYITPWAYLSLSASKRFSIPLFSDYPDFEIYENNIVYKSVTKNILKKVFKNSLHIFPISNPLKDRLINTYKIPREKITIIPNGVDTEVFNPAIDGSKIKERFGLSDSLVIGYIGALVEWVRLDVLFVSFKKLKKDYESIKVLIVGGQDCEIEKVKLLCKKMGIDNEVIFTGYVPYSEIPDYIASFDIAVATYSKDFRISASSPLKIMEYMSMGKAVVADKLGSKTIKNTENGILFEPEDAESLENAIMMILDDSRLKRKLEINARETALKYDWKILSKKMEDIIIENV
ncbi:Glycosyltransferase involved in cell wall bisynthesis [Candidatus Methanophagaceae archaeon]|nr:Glycosyltransferase involved in cell wall bisynthesis [Methanophagales archaeon]